MSFSFKNIFLHKFLGVCVFLCTLQLAYGQVNGGQKAYKFLDLSANPRTAGVGGLHTSLSQGDPNMFLSNPAMLADTSMNGVATFNYNPFYGGISHFLLTYAHDFKGNTGQLGMGLQYISYGKIIETDDAGNLIGEFQAADYAFTLGKSFQTGNFQLGFNAKFAASTIGAYSNFGFATDLGAAFSHPTKDLKVGLVLSNIGFSLRSYLPQTRPTLPFDARLGISFKPKHMPLRFSITAYRLYRWDIAYNDPATATTTDPFTGQPQTKKISFTDKLFRHLVFGAEIILHKNFQLRFGYNHLRNRELRFKDFTALAGFSGGVAFRVKGYEFAFTRATFNARGTNFLCLSKNLNDFYKKR